MKGLNDRPRVVSGELRHEGGFSYGYTVTALGPRKLNHIREQKKITASLCNALKVTLHFVLEQKERFPFPGCHMTSKCLM